MAVTRYTLESVTGTEDAKGPKYNAHYLVRTNSHLDFCLTVISSLPWQIGDRFAIGNDYDPRAVVLSAGATQVPGNNYAWNYSVEFGVPDKKDNANPLAEPPEIELVFAMSARPFDRDVHGKPVANSIGDRFDDILEREDSQPILRISRNEPISQAMYGTELRDCVNRSVWQGAAKRTVKMQAPTLRMRYHNIIGRYVEKAYEFKFSDETWQFVLLNQGYYELEPGKEPKDPKKRVRLKDDEGKEITTPLALSKAGSKLGVKEQPVWITFDGYRESILPDFGQLI